MDETSASAFVTLLAQVWANVKTMVTTISSNELLLIPVGLGFAGGVIGLGKRLMGTGRRRR